MSTTSPRNIAETRLAPEREPGPTRDRSIQTRGSGDRQRYQFVEGEEITAKLAIKLQKLQETPVVAGTRFTEIVTAFDGFPWAQDTVMAALQLEEVLVMFLQRHREVPGETLQR